MRTVLILMTALCVAGAIMAKTMELRHQVGMWGMILFYSLLGIFITRKYRENQRRMTKTALEGVAVKVDVKWVRRVKSRWFLLIATFTGVSITFAPLCLLWCGASVRDYGPVEWVLVPLCLLIIYFVPGFYMSLAGEVIYQLMKFEPKDGQIVRDESEDASQEK